LRSPTWKRKGRRTRRDTVSAKDPKNEFAEGEIPGSAHAEPSRNASRRQAAGAARRDLPPGATYAETTRAMIEAVRASFAQLTDDDALYLIRMVR
jgi:hypothetical protein